VSVNQKTPLAASRQDEKQEKNPHAVALGRAGGKVGGKARAQSLSAEERRAAARHAANARWGKRRLEKH
jgi:hypothetical protein